MFLCWQCWHQLCQLCQLCQLARIGAGDIKSHFLTYIQATACSRRNETYELSYATALHDLKLHANFPTSMHIHDPCSAHHQSSKTSSGRLRDSTSRRVIRKGSYDEHYTTFRLVNTESSQGQRGQEKGVCTT
ncbi:hypothetical protein B0H11DRAFT_2070779 [Mycena galericulata]|nr:hypothetical protein B0H11DRAFT_2070779 [Mycena galericulata]